MVELAQAANVDVFAFQPKDYASKEDYEREIAVELQRRGVELIVLAGYMRLLSPSFVEFYSGRIINIHPSLAACFSRKRRDWPSAGLWCEDDWCHGSFRGWRHGYRTCYCSKAVEIKEGETAEVLAERIHAVEQKLYSEVVSWFAQGRISLNGRNVTITE